METVFNHTFTVFPEHSNYMPPMIFGGKLLAEMDICAAMTARRFLYSSPTGARDAVTVAVTGINFYVGAIVKDLIFLIISIGYEKFLNIFSLYVKGK